MVLHYSLRVGVDCAIFSYAGLRGSVCDIFHSYSPCRSHAIVGCLNHNVSCSSYVQDGVLVNRGVVASTCDGERHLRRRNELAVEDEYHVSRCSDYGGCALYGEVVVIGDVYGLLHCHAIASALHDDVLLLCPRSHVNLAILVYGGVLQTRYDCPFS